MQRKTLLASSVAACLAFATGCGGSKPPAVNPRADLSGHWQLNLQESDDAAQKIAARLPGYGRATGTDSTGGAADPATGTRGRGGWSGGGRGGRGGRGGFRGGSVGPVDAQAIARRHARAELTIFLAQYGPEDLDVRLTPGAVRFVMHGSLDTLALKTDGGKQATKIPQGDDDVQVTTRAAWRDGWLVVRRDVDGGGTITETYLRSGDGRQLYVVVQLELPTSGRAQDDGTPHAIEFRRVYDPGPQS